MAHPLESAIQHLGRAARCQRRRLSVWWGADERQTGRVFEYNLCRGIYRINSLSSSEISSLYFLHLRSWPCIRCCSLDCWEFASSACCQHADNVCMHAPTRAGLMCIDGLYMSSREEEEEGKKGCIYYHHRFYCSETCLVPEILNTHKRALRRYNGGDAPILSKCSLTESYCFFFLRRFVARLACENQSALYTWVTMASASPRALLWDR